MDLNKMVAEMNEPLLSFVMKFVKDCYENKENVDVDVIEVLKMVKDRYIKGALSNEKGFILLANSLF